MSLVWRRFSLWTVSPFLQALTDAKGRWGKKIFKLRKRNGEVQQTGEQSNKPDEKFNQSNGSWSSGASRTSRPLLWRFYRLTIKEQTFFVKRLSFLIRGGVPILESLRLLRQSRSKHKTQIFDEIIKDVENGQFLAVSLAKIQVIFLAILPSISFEWGNRPDFWIKI